MLSRLQKRKSEEFVKWWSILVSKRFIARFSCDVTNVKEAQSKGTHVPGYVRSIFCWGSRILNQEISTRNAHWAISFIAVWLRPVLIRQHQHFTWLLFDTLSNFIVSSKLVASTKPYWVWKGIKQEFSKKLYKNLVIALACVQQLARDIINILSHLNKDSNFMTSS